MNEELDLEDIESRLYSQFYHGSEKEPLPNTDLYINNTSMRTPAMVCNFRCNNRYFHKTKYLNQETYISVDCDADHIYASLQNSSKSADASDQGSFANHFHNNITVNQFTLPVIINPELNSLLTPTLKRRSASPWPDNDEALSVQKSRRRQLKLQKKRQRNRLKRRQNNLSSVVIEVNLSNQKTKVSNELVDVISISDESDDEPVIIQDALEKVVKPKSSSVKHSGNITEDYSDNDVIFVPPPPAEVIDLDKDTEEETLNSNEEEAVENDVEDSSPSLYKVPNSASTPTKSPNKIIQDHKNCKQNIPELNTCNDFLDNSSIDNSVNKFNFGLHGSDFNNTQGDAIRQGINKVDYCETESSCSTNDLNRDINSSLKAAVFDEIEFPREDIFSEKNLESFSTYITPKRSGNKRAETNSLVDFLDASIEKVIDNESSSNSSSESDYDASESMGIYKVIDSFECNKKLPDLSPLQCDKKSAKKGMAKKKTATNFFKINSKGKNLSARSSVLCESLDFDDDEIEQDKSVGKKQVISAKAPKNSRQQVLIDNLNLQKRKQADASEKGGSQDILRSENVHKKKLESSSSEDETSNETNVVSKVQRKRKNKSSIPRISEDNNTDCNVFKGIVDHEMEHSITEATVSFPQSCTGTADSVDISQTSNLPGSAIVLIKTGNVTLGPDLIFNVIKKQSLQTFDEECDGQEVALNKLKQQTTKKNKGKTKVKKDYCELEKIKNSNSSNPVSQNSGKSEATVEHQSCVQEVENLNQNNKNNVTVESTSINYEEINKNLGHTDEESSSLSSFEVIDEVNSENTETHVEILSSDSESVEMVSPILESSIHLANCTSKTVSICDLGEPTSANDGSGDRFRSNIVDNTYDSFDVDAIFQSQSDDPEIWKIRPEDRTLHFNIARNKKPRCNKCRQLGHMAVRCTEKIGPHKCSLCGHQGHQEPRCPNKICTQCGNKGDYSTTYCWKCFKFRNSVCNICNMRGHIAKTCPDLWRRYHLTTEEGPIVILKGPQLKPRNEQWCSGCANQGHLEHECNYYNREYPPISPCIVSYEDVLYPTGADNNVRVDETLQEVDASPNQSPAAVLQNITYTPQDSPSNDIPFDRAPSILDTNTQTPVSETSDSTKKTKVFNPFSMCTDYDQSLSMNHPVLHQMRLNYLNLEHNIECNQFYGNRESRIMDSQNTTQSTQSFKNNKRRIRHLIMSMPYRIVKQFLKKELTELDNLLAEGNPRYLKKKLFKYDKLVQSKKTNDNILIERSFWNRVLNMFIFGIHKFGEARSHIDYLQGCLSGSGRNMDKNHRKLLLDSYSYIFGVDRHVNVNYYKIIQQLIQVYDENM